MAKMTGTEIFFFLWQIGEVLFKEPKEPEIETKIPEKVVPFYPQDVQKIIDLRPEPVPTDPIVLVEQESLTPPLPNEPEPIPHVVTRPSTTISSTVPTLRTVL